MAALARRVVLGVPAGTPAEHVDALEADSFRQYLRRAHDAVAPGEEWTEFVSGGCGRRNELVLEVLEADGERIDEETEFEFVYR